MQIQLQSQYLSEKQGCQIWLPNWVRLAPNGTNLGLYKISFCTFWLQVDPKQDKSGNFKDYFLYIQALKQILKANQNVLKLIIISPRFVPSWANLTEFGTTHYIPARYMDLYDLYVQICLVTTYMLQMIQQLVIQVDCSDRNMTTGNHNIDSYDTVKKKCSCRSYQQGCQIWAQKRSD